MNPQPQEVDITILQTRKQAQKITSNKKSLGLWVQSSGVSNPHLSSSKGQAIPTMTVCHPSQWNYKSPPLYSFATFPVFEMLCEGTEWCWTTPMGSTDACSLLSRHSVQVEKQFHNSGGSATSNCSLRTEAPLFLHLRVGGEALSAILNQACIWKPPRAVPQGACAMCQFSLWKSPLALCG